VHVREKTGRHKFHSFQTENIPPHEPLSDPFGHIVPIGSEPLCAIDAMETVRPILPQP